MAELKLECKLARDYVPVDLDDTLAYLLIKILPDTNLNYGSLPVNISLILDVSGSMRGDKIKKAKQAAREVVNSLKPTDALSIIIYSDDARAIVPSTLVTDKFSIMSKIDKIGIYGGTRMYHGLEAGAREIKKAASKNSINRMIVLTDGETEGEEQCLTIARQEAQNNCVLTAFGIGNEYNEDFLKEISDLTLGSFYHLKYPEQITSQFGREMQAITAAVISNVSLSLNMVNDVTLDKIHRIYPDTVELFPSIEAGGNIATIPVGNLRKDSRTIFGAQFKLPRRTTTGRVRISQAFVSFSIPSMQLEDRVEKSNVVINFTDDSDLCSQADKEVIGYFNQLNIQSLISRAVKETKSGNIAGATQILNQAQQFTQRIGNVQLTRTIDEAVHELESTGSISPGMVKTVRAGSGHTVCLEDEE